MMEKKDTVKSILSSGSLSNSFSEKKNLASPLLFTNNRKSLWPCEASTKNPLLNKVSSIQQIFFDQPNVLAI